MSRKTTLLALMLCLVACLIVSGCTSATDYRYSGDSEGSGAASGESEDLVILDHGMEWGEYGNLYIAGTAKNVGEKRLSYGSVEVKFYDADGNLIGNSLDNWDSSSLPETRMPVSRLS